MSTASRRRVRVRSLARRGPPRGALQTCAQYGGYFLRAPYTAKRVQPQQLIVETLLVALGDDGAESNRVYADPAGRVIDSERAGMEVISANLLRKRH